jgi:putative SOS response-associated peptidase YedK
MCGRFVSRTGTAIERYFNIRPHQFQLFDRYNVAPSINIPVIRLIEGERVLSLMRWGLVPCWAKDSRIGYKMINARAETVATKPAFKSAYKTRRCLIPASGFYEWKRHANPKIPHFIHKRNDAPLAFAGLWESCEIEDDSVESCTIITTSPNDMMAQLHNRMPVILAPETFDWWMTGSTDEVGQLLVACPSEELEAYPISRQVNNPRNEGPELLRPAA